MKSRTKLHVVVPVFNGPELLDRCLESLAAQDDVNYSVIVADDASDDPGVENVVDRWVRTCRHFSYRRQPVNRCATRNIVETISLTNMDATDIVVIVDGDDRLTRDDALSRIRAAFLGDVEVAYGSFIPDPFNPHCPTARPIPGEVLAQGTIRAFTKAHGQYFNHPYAFRRRAFNAINPFEYLSGETGEWLRHGYDITLMCALIEVAGRRVAFMPELLYAYTSDRPEAVHLIHQEETAAEFVEVTSRERRYLPYDT